VIGLLERLSGYPRTLRGFAVIATALLFIFLLDNLMIYAFGWQGLVHTLTQLGLFPEGRSFKAVGGIDFVVGVLEVAAALSIIAACIVWVTKTQRTLQDDVAMYDSLASYIIRASFWAVMLVGIADMAISFLRVEGFLAAFVGKDLTTQFGRPSFRGMYIHYPLIAISLVIAWFNRSLGFIWLALMIVGAEFLIVITRFVFSYEQAFMGDLVRFWYAALFLFASAYTLMKDGHVRVDVLYAGFSERGQAVTNALGSVLLGLPLCWTILILGTASKGSTIVSPLTSFEISQSGFGMYTKYLMAGYLMIFAISMAIQFISFFLSSMSKFRVAKPASEQVASAAPESAAATRV
jgi:TRAP-type mannitol/chloroaromatic compound transport system permease small subunit